MLTVRPKVAELVFQPLRNIPLHPELFQVYESRSVTRENYQAKIDITRAGHVVTWRSGGMTLTEVAAAAQHPLPEKRRLMSYALRGQRSDRFKYRGGVRLGIPISATKPAGPGGVLDLPAGNWRRTAAARACSTSSTPAGGSSLGRRA